MKTALITGGNSGIGKAAATELAKKGYKVIIHGRDAAKTKAAAEEIKNASGNKDVDFIVADISVIKGMKDLVSAVRQKTDTINALVLSTGVILPKHIVTADGLEMGFSVQYLSRFAVVNLLLPELKKGNAKIAHVGAPTLKNAQIYFDDIAFKNGFSMMKALGQEMLANHMFVQEFAKRVPELKMNIMHVGIAKTGIMRETNFLMKMLLIFATTPEKAVKNVIYMVDDDSVNFSGYFLKKPTDHSVKDKINFDSKITERLWNESLEMIK